MINLLKKSVKKIVRKKNDIDIIGFSHVFNGNFGDLLGPYIYQKLTNIKPTTFPVNEPEKAEERPHLLMIGSILHRANKNSYIWGIGLMNPKDVEINKHNLSSERILAVRGPITRKYLVQSNIIKKERKLAYGDPAILLPIIYDKSQKIKYKFGLIPHVKDYNRTLEVYKDDPEIKVIKFGDMGYGYKNIESKIDEIRSCERIISSSLHGVILGHAYNIDSAWVNFTKTTKMGKSGTNHAKFKDYFLSVDLDFPKPADLTEVHFKSIKLHYTNVERTKLRKMQTELLRVAPFEIKKDS